MDPDYSNYRPPGQQFPPTGPQQVNKGVLRIIIIAFVLPVLLGVGMLIFTFFPSVLSPLEDIIDPGPIKGDLLDAVYIPDATGDSGKLWIHTDASFTFIRRIETPGRLSVSRECANCKTITYIYDPVTEEIIKEWETPLNNVPPDTNLFLEKGEVWMVSRQTSDFEPIIEKYNAETGEKLLDTQSFIDDHSEIDAGIIEFIMHEDPRQFNLALNNGKKLIYLFEEDKFFQSESELSKFYATSGGETVTIFALGEDGSDTRKKLYSLTGPKSEISRGNCDSYLDSADSLEFFCDATAKLLNEKIYLESMILYKDDDAAIILHQDQIGKGAKRFITSVDKNGSTKWSIPQENLFPEIAFDPDDPFSELFFIKLKVEGDRSDNLFIFKLDGVGLIGFDFVTGEKLWEVDI